MVTWTIERLDRAHLRGDFECGKPSLTTFLRTLVSQYEKRNLGRTFVACEVGHRRVLGYYTIASGGISFDALPSGDQAKLPNHPVPVVLIARLAVDLAAHGKGLGSLLLRDALNRCVQLAETLGIHAVTVETIDHEAQSFYKKYGFVSLLDSELHLYLPMATIRKSQGNS